MASSETLCIAKKKLTSYGSMLNNPCQKENYIRHPVSENDTIQGIALKYGVTIEKLKRANKLWTSDSLFLRPYLLVPVPRAPELPDSPAVMAPASSPPGEESAGDFLSRIDNSIALTRDKVKSFSHPSHSEEELPKARKRQGGGLTSSNSLCDLETPSSVVVVNCGYRVRSSLRKLEQEHDEIFQL